MMEDRVAVVTNARHFIGPGWVKVLADYGARVICHDEEFSDPDNRLAFEAEFPGTVALAAQDPEEVVTAALDLIGGIEP